MVERGLREPLWRPGLLEDRPTHAGEDIDVASEAGEGQPEYAVADDGDEGEVRGEADHRRLDLLKSLTRPREGRGRGQAAILQFDPRRGHGLIVSIAPPTSGRRAC